MLEADLDRPTAAAVPTKDRRRRVPTPFGLMVAAAAIASARLGLRPISDNSTLVHLKTGILLLRSGRVPLRDPYSFTAAGHRWIVQSWLASLAYAVAYNAGHHLLLIEQGCVYAALGVIIMLAARSSTALRSGAAGLLAICACAPGWSPRPLMFGLVCLALTVLITTRRAHPAWLIPVVWVWANTHGSYPLGVAWLGTTALGEAIDVRGWPRRAIRYVAGFAAGLLVSLANPIGWRLLAFPLVALQKRSTFANIVEWRSPNFQDPNSFLALVFIVAALVVLLRAALLWSRLLPVCAFLAAGLVAERNLAPFAVVLAPALAAALAQPQVTDPWWRWLAAAAHRIAGLGWVRTIGGAVAIVAAVGLSWTGIRGPTLDLSSYPVAAFAYLQSTGRLQPAHQVAAVDVVGCYLIWRDGPAVKDFIDDRYDMYPPAVVRDASTLANARSDAPGVLDKWHVDTVVWSINQALPGELITAGGWVQVWSDAHWAVLERSPAS